MPTAAQVFNIRPYTNRPRDSKHGLSGLLSGLEGQGKPNSEILAVGF